MTGAGEMFQNRVRMKKKQKFAYFFVKKLVKHCYSYCILYNCGVLLLFYFFFWLEFYFESCFLKVPPNRKSTKIIFLYCFRLRITLVWNHCPLILVGLFPWSSGSHLPFEKVWNGKEEKSLHTEDIEVHMKILKDSGGLVSSVCVLLKSMVSQGFHSFFENKIILNERRGLTKVVESAALLNRLWQAFKFWSEL